MTTLTSAPAHRSQTALFGRIRWWLLSLALVLLPAGGLMAVLSPFPTQAAGPICYVDADATGAATGSNWTDAYTTVQDALADAACTEIWVAEGVYYPDEGAGQTNDVMTSTFVLTNGVALYGGFEGTETQRDQRDPATNITVLSGDIDQNDTTDPNGVVTDTANITGTNAYHVVTGSGTDSTAVLDGFTVTAGQANNGTYPDNSGGGMVNNHGSPTLTDVIFAGNSADNSGGGMHNWNHSNPTLTNVTFSANSTNWIGGGMDNGNNSSPTLIDVTFSGNSTDFYGGGMYNLYSSPVLTHVTFSHNSATTSGSNGGGMYNDHSNPVLTDVTFSANSADNGGGLLNGDHSSPTLSNVTFSGNAAHNGGGMLNGDHSSPTLTNVTFSNNSAIPHDPTDYGGGGILNYYYSSPTLTDVTFSYNSHGGMVNEDHSSPTLTDVTFFHNSHGGMVNENHSSPTLTNVTFSGNSADSGGGMRNYASNPALTNVIFSGNSATYYGGGMYNDSSSPTLTDITFSDNSATYGGGMYNGESNFTLMDVTFSGNSANYGGGGMYNGGSSPTLADVTFSGNSADSGGGMLNYASSPTLTNVTFSGNSAAHGGGMYNYYIDHLHPSKPTLTNTIIANSTSGGDCVNGSNGFVAPGSANNLIEDSGANACDLTNGVNGNIIGPDPKLGALTDYGGPGKQVFSLLPGSPAVDAGTNANCPATDQRGATRPVGAACDIGAFELGYYLTLSKQVDDPTPLPGQTVTFTLIVANTDLTVTHGLLSDTLPVGLNFLGPITLEPAGAGNVGTAPPTLASGLTISNGQHITVTFPVTVSSGLAAGTLLTNTAAITAAEIPTSTPASTVITVTVENHCIYLPLVLKNYP